MTGLIYLAIIALWAAVLIPIWLRRHDAKPSQGHFDKAMRSLKDMGPATASSRPASRGSAERQAHVKASMKPVRARNVKVTVAQPPPAPRVSSAAARRRRRVLLGLLTVTAGLGVAGAMGRVPVWVAAIPLALLGAFVLLAIRATRSSVERRIERTVASQLEAKPARERASGRATFAEAVAERRRQAAAVGDTAAAAVDAASDEADAPSQAAGSGLVTVRRGVRHVDQVALAGAAAPRSWEAVPATLPTYVTAPRASEIPRVIDLTHAGEWSASAMLAQARAQRERERVERATGVVEFETASRQSRELAERVDDGGVEKPGRRAAQSPPPAPVAAAQPRVPRREARGVAGPAHGRRARRAVND